MSFKKIGPIKALIYLGRKINLPPTFHAYYLIRVKFGGVREPHAVVLFVKIYAGKSCSFSCRTLPNELSVVHSELEAPSCNKRYMCVTSTEVDTDVSKNTACSCSIQKIETMGASDLHGVTSYMPKT